MSQTAVTAAPGTAAQPLGIPMPRLPRPIIPTRTSSYPSNGTPIIDRWPRCRCGATAVAAWVSGRGGDETARRQCCSPEKTSARGRSEFHGVHSLPESDWFMPILLTYERISCVVPTLSQATA